MSVVLRACSHKQEDDTTSLLDQECSQWVQPLLRVGLNSSRHCQSITPGVVYQCLCFERQGHGLILLHPKQGYKVSLGYSSQPPPPLSPLVALVVSHFILTYAEHMHIFISYDVMSWLVYILRSDQPGAIIISTTFQFNHFFVIKEIKTLPLSEACTALLNALSDKQGACSPFKLEHGPQRPPFPSSSVLHSLVTPLLQLI